MREKLFSLASLEVHESELGQSPLEGYVINGLPLDLRAVSEGTLGYAELAAKQTTLLNQVTQAINDNSDVRVAQVTQLDLLFMLGGYIPAGEAMDGHVPSELAGLIRQQGDRFSLEPYMSYKLLIDINSSEYQRTGIMRVFADGEDGLHERDFYLGHFLAEPFARDAAYSLRSLVERPKPPDTLAVLEKARANLIEFTRYMAHYAQLPKEAFAYFRNFLSSYPNGTRNASGAFMPSVQLLELALLRPSAMYDFYLSESMPYFPDCARPIIDQWRTASASGMNVIDQLEAGLLQLDDTEHKVLLAIIDEFVRFRMIHLGITKAHLPYAFSSLDKLTRKSLGALAGEQPILDPEARGTAGFDVRSVLANGVYRLLRTREWLTRNNSAGNL